METSSYDPISEVSSWTAKEANGTSRQNEQLGYGYDAGNNLHLRTNNALVQTFGVDTLNQLSTVTRSGTMTVSGALPAPATSVTVNGTVAQTNGDLTFAAAGNTLISGMNSFTNIAVNVYGLAVTNILSVNLPSTVNFQYDANGNLTNDGTRVFYYDAENRLTNVTVAGQYQTVFAYDGLSRRRVMTNYTWQSSAWVKTNETRYICDGMEVVQERNSNNTPVVTYTRGLDLSTSLSWAGGVGGMLARADTNGPTYYHADGSGNITGLIDTNQLMVARYMYDAFGRCLAQSGTMAAVNQIGFSSFYTVFGMVLSPTRPYLPELHRWGSRDPIQEAGGVNQYEPMGNNPVNNVDPDGMEWQWWHNLWHIHGGEDPLQDPESKQSLANNAGVGVTQLTDENGNPVSPTEPLKQAAKNVLENMAMLPFGEEEGAYAAADEALQAARAAKAARALKAAKCLKASAKAADKAKLLNAERDADLFLGIIDKNGNVSLFQSGQNDIFGHSDLVRQGLATPGETLGFSVGLDAQGNVVVNNISELNTHLGLGGALPSSLFNSISQALGGP